MDLILIGLAVALEPIPLTAFILVLSSEGGTRKGLGFVLGWIVTLIGIVVVTIAFTGGEPLKSGTAPSTAVLVVQILLGVVLLLLSWRQRKKRGQPRPPPRWLAGLDKLTVVGAMGLAFLLQPWTLTAAGVASITNADVSEPATVVTLIGFVILCASSYVAMEVYAWKQPAAARARLEALRVWIDDHRDAAIIWLSLIVGVWLIGHAAYLLAS